MAHALNTERRHIVPNIEIGAVIAYGGSSVVRKGRRQDGTECAVKIMEVTTAEEYNEAKREGAIHRLLQHKHIVKMKEMHAVKPFVYIAFDNAENRELFSYIEPGSGIAQELCHMYAQQLHSALQYIHARGICHRDIKPENILLDRRYNLVLTDFGSATIYKDAQGKRALKKKCGSTSYMAPEVHYQEYDGEKADVWSYSVVVLAMMTGVVPWNEARNEDRNYDKYRITTVRDFSPFNLLTRDKLALIEKMLHVDAHKRATIEEIAHHEWMKKKSMYTGPDGLVRSRNEASTSSTYRLLTARCMCITIWQGVLAAASVHVI